MYWITIVGMLILGNPNDTTINLKPLIIEESYNPESKQIYEDLKVVYPLVLKISREYKVYKSGKVGKEEFADSFEDQFYSILLKLTKSQGKLIVKLIHRELGKTAYELCVELRGSFRASIYQKTAEFVGNDLNSKYDKLKDKSIENIIIHNEWK